MQNNTIIGQGVPEIRGGTDTQTQDEDLLYRWFNVCHERSE